MGIDSFVAEKSKEYADPKTALYRLDSIAFIADQAGLLDMRIQSMLDAVNRITGYFGPNRMEALKAFESTYGRVMGHLKAGPRQMALISFDYALKNIEKRVVAAGNRTTRILQNIVEEELLGFEKPSTKHGMGRQYLTEAQKAKLGHTQS